MKSKYTPLLKTFLWIMFCAACALSHAQTLDYPSKPITFIVPFSPGSGTDSLARSLAQEITSEFSVNVIVEDKPGANGFIAAQYVAKAPPDGYTVLITTHTTHAANEHLFKKIPYDPVKDFSPVALLGKGYMALVVNPNSNIRSVSDLIQEAKKRPGQINFASGSSSSRLAGELLRQMTGIEVNNIPYKSNPLAITDLIGGHFDFMFVDAPTGLPQVKADKLRAIAVSGTRHISTLPGVPTVEETGIKGYDMSFWTAAYLPAGAPAPVQKKLHDMLAKVSNSKLVGTYHSGSGGEVAISTPEGLAQFQAAESLKWGQIIKNAGILPE
jgi:tripartite-type tricarboxylate transporter receptor subunit TctC